MGSSPSSSVAKVLPPCKFALWLACCSRASTYRRLSYLEAEREKERGLRGIELWWFGEATIASCLSTRVQTPLLSLLGEVLRRQQVELRGRGELPGRLGEEWLRV